MLDISGKLPLSEAAFNVASIIVFILIILSVLKFSVWKKTKKSE